ncbi:MAG TPA: DUF5329 domain-containing protein [Bacteroidia bacterium]|jgi:hypothetical protein|nr:DUF5329 domain-containing protein [Bacteroidia bacterium]
MKRIFLIVCSCLLFAGKSAVPVVEVNAFIIKLTEEQKIGMLIDYIKNLKDAVFIRNGDEHTAEEAAEHLRSKRKKAGSKVKTAVEFIVHIASKSSISGKPYFIKFKDGKIIPSKDLLVEELKRIEKSNL